jgi:hypothetical protein
MPQQLVEAHVLEEMIQAFLHSSEEIQQTTFMQILKISEKIAQEDKHGRFLCNLLFTTLDKIDANSNDAQVSYAICQGWLDILIHGSYKGQHAQSFYSSADIKISAKLDAEDVAQLFVHVSKFLVRFLNLGSFEGASGAKTLVVMRLTLVLNMIILIRHAQDDKRHAINEMFSQCQENGELRQ